MEEDNHSFNRPNPWYPRHVSDRADELIDEIDERQAKKLFKAMKEKSLVEWWLWLENARVDICKYDYLKPSERKRRLQKVSSDDALMLHHACIYVELWRARTHSKYFHFPTNAPPINTPESQREMMLAVLASYSAFDERDLWPFEVPEGEAGGPFRD